MPGTSPDFLMKQLSPAPTIRPSRSLSGHERDVLKRGFKAVFGETVLDFSIRCRMQHALALLRGQRTPVRASGRSLRLPAPNLICHSFRATSGCGQRTCAAICARKSRNS